MTTTRKTSEAGGTKVEWLYIKQLAVVWDSAQGNLRKFHVDFIADNFDPDLFDLPHVTNALPPRGLHHVIDGAHRRAAAERVLGPDQKIQCVIHLNCTTPQQAARIFRKINSNRRPKTPVENFKVSVTEGNQTHIGITKILAKLGLYISPTPVENGLAAVQALLFVYSKYGADVLYRTISALQSTWKNDRLGYQGGLILGFGAFIFEFPHANLDRLQTKIAKKFTPIKLVTGARASRLNSNRSLPDEVTETLIAHYNAALGGSSRLQRSEKVRSHKKKSSNFHLDGLSIE